MCCLFMMLHIVILWLAAHLMSQLMLPLILSPPFSFSVVHVNKNAKAGLLSIHRNT